MTADRAPLRDIIHYLMAGIVAVPMSHGRPLREATSTILDAALEDGMDAETFRVFEAVVAPWRSAET